VACVNDKDRPDYAELLRLLGLVDGWAARIDPDAGRPQPPPGSALRGDDLRTHPYELSHAAWHSLSHAVDHLNCLQTLLKDAGLIHIFAPYSLVRSALENASAAVWMLTRQAGPTVWPVGCGSLRATSATARKQSGWPGRLGRVLSKSG
jgi:hypothetical protein